MPRKKVSFNSKASENPNLEQWVTERTQPEIKVDEEKMKRLTIDVPESLHKALKRKAVDDGVTMAELVRKMIEDSLVR